MFAHPLPSIPTHFQPTLIKNLTNPIRMDPKSYHFPYFPKRPLPGKPEESSPSKCKKNTLLQKICFSNSHSPKILKPKMLPPNCLTHYLATVSLFPSRKIDSKGICQKHKKIQKFGFNYSLFSHC